MADYPLNNNFLSPLGFKFFLKKLPNVNFFVQSVNLPSIGVGVARQATPFANIPVPGDRMTFGDLQVQFRVDENMENYKEIYNWITGIGRPDSFDQYKALQDTHEVTADGVLMVLSSAKNPTTEISFFGMFPTQLSELVFDTKQLDVDYIDATVTFAFRKFEIKSLLS